MAEPVRTQGSVTVLVLNAIRNSASPLYASDVPVATKDNIALVGDAIYSHDPTYNEFSGLLNKIALTMTSKRLFENKLSAFKSGSLLTANEVEEYFIKKIKASAQSKDGLTTLARMKPDIAKAYYKENRSDTYGITVSFKQIRSAFRSPDGVESLMNEIVQELYNSANIDEYNIMKELIGQVEDLAYVYQVPMPTPVEILDGDANVIGVSNHNIKNFIKTIRKASNDFEEPTSLFHLYQIVDPDDATTLINDPEVITFTPKSNQVLFINKDIEAEVSVEVLATAINVSGVEYPAPRIIVGDFGTAGTGVLAILADDRFLKVFDTFKELLTQINAQGAYTNYFLHIDQILAISPFCNIAVFKTTDPNAE